MTRGFLLFAHNNEQVNYGLLALWQARRIKTHLNSAVSIVTDPDTAYALDGIDLNWRNSFDQVIFSNADTTQTKRYIDRSLTFRNVDRIAAWDLTPYDETIVMDTDIVIQGPTLNKLWGHAQDLLVCRRSTDLMGVTAEEFQRISDKSLPFVWATVVYFKKTDHARVFFEQCKLVKSQYNWYRYVYQLNTGPMRNDFVWSIALHTLGGTASGSWAQSIPWNLHHSNNEDRLLKMTQDAVRILTDQGLVLIKHQDVHIFNKLNLIEHIKQEMGIL